MFSGYSLESFIEDRILKKNLDRVVIYPYGKNGRNFERLYNNMSGNKIRHIIDNYLAATEKNVITLDEYKKIREECDLIVLTVENPALLKEMTDEISEIANAEIIESLYEYQKIFKEQLHLELKKRVAISNLIGDEAAGVYSHERDDKIHIRIVHSRMQTFNTIFTFCEAIKSDPELNLKIIVGWDVDRDCIDQLKKHGYEYVLWTEYDVKEDQPDVLILHQPYDDITQLPNINEYVKLVVVVNTLLIRNEKSVDEFWRIQNRSYLRFAPDYFLCDSLLYEEIRDSRENIPFQVIEMGNAKYDGIYNATKCKTIPEQWWKLEGKKVVLWTTDHGFDLYTIRHTTFDLYAKTIFDYAKEHLEMGMIVRLHPDVKKELKKLGYWSQEDYSRLISYCNSTSNMVFDENETYNEAYSVADAIIADGCCGISVSALPTLKPICVTFRSKWVKAMYPELIDAYYRANDENEVRDFLNMVLKGEDTKYEKRLNLSRKYVKHFDGKNGYRIKEFIKERYKSVTRCRPIEE